MVHAQKARRAAVHFFLQLLVYLAENLTVFGCFGARVQAPLFFIWTKTDQHNVLVTHHGIRSLQSNTLWAGFPPRDPLGRCWGPARQSRQSELPSDRPDRAVKRGGRKRRGEKDTRLDPHTQSLTFIINYGCFCFISPQPLTTELLAVKGGEDGGRREEKRANFHQKKNYLSKQVRWSRAFARGLWKRCGQTEIYLGLIGSGRVVRGE